MNLTSDDAALYNTIGGYAIADVGDSYSSQSFYIELWNGDKWLAKSSAASGSSLAQFITGSNNLNPVAGTGWVPTSYSVPEPTSGLLFVIGGMLLGLKRKLGEQILTAVYNFSEAPQHVTLEAYGPHTDLLTGEKLEIVGDWELSPYGFLWILYNP
jgi:hypothetical protein